MIKTYPIYRDELGTGKQLGTVEVDSDNASMDIRFVDWYTGGTSVQGVIDSKGEIIHFALNNMLEHSNLRLTSAALLADGSYGIGYDFKEKKDAPLFNPPENGLKWWGPEQ